jgi:ankyrin repeat protein
VLPHSRARSDAYSPHVQVDGGLDVGARDDDGHTPLHIAAMHGRYAVVELLVARGANMDEENDEGLTPRHLINLFVHHSSASVSAAAH